MGLGTVGLAAFIGLLLALYGLRRRKERLARKREAKCARDLSARKVLAQSLGRHKHKSIKKCAFLASEQLHYATDALSCQCQWRYEHLSAFAQFLLGWAQVLVSDDSCDGEDGVVTKLLCRFVEEARANRYELAHAAAEEMWLLPDQAIPVQILSLKLNIWIQERCDNKVEARRLQELLKTLPVMAEAFGDKLKFKLTGDNKR